MLFFFFLRVGGGEGQREKEKGKRQSMKKQNNINIHLHPSYQTSHSTTTKRARRALSRQRASVVAGVGVEVNDRRRRPSFFLPSTRPPASPPLSAFILRPLRHCCTCLAKRKTGKQANGHTSVTDRHLHLFSHPPPLPTVVCRLKQQKNGVLPARFELAASDSLESEGRR